MTSFCWTFSALSFHKDVPYLIVIPFSFSRFQRQYVIKFSFRKLMTSKILRIIFDHPLKQCPAGRKIVEDRNTNVSITWEQKLLFRRNKKYFSYYLKGNNLVEKKYSPHKLNCCFAFSDQTWYCEDTLEIQE